jgi:hypothetical protein
LYCTRLLALAEKWRHRWPLVRWCSTSTIVQYCIVLGTAVQCSKCSKCKFGLASPTLMPCHGPRVRTLQARQRSSSDFTMVTREPSHSQAQAQRACQLAVSGAAAAAGGSLLMLAEAPHTAARQCQGGIHTLRAHLQTNNAIMQAEDILIMYSSSCNERQGSVQLQRGQCNHVQHKSTQVYS